MPQRQMTNIEAINRLNRLGLKYDFTYFEYNGNRENKSIVICPVHGKFKVSYHSVFKSTHGLVCKKCRNIHQRNVLLKHYRGKDFISVPIDYISTKQRKYWIFERCRVEALNYNTKRIFSNKSRIAFTIATQNGWLEEICVHMKKRCGCSVGCKRSPIQHWTKES